MRLLLNVQKPKVLQLQLFLTFNQGSALEPRYIVLMNTTTKLRSTFGPHTQKKYCSLCPGPFLFLCF